MVEVLYISYDGMTDPLGESQVIPYLKGISAAGYSITLISAEKSEPYKKRRSKIERIFKDANIDWHPVEYNYKPPLFSTIKDYRKIKNTAIQLHKKKRFKIVHCRSYIPAMVGLFLKKKYKVRFIFDMRGFWADERVDGKIWNLKNPIFYIVYKFFKKKEISFFSEADYTVSLTEAGKSIIHSWEKVKNQPIPIVTIPCCTDYNLFNTSKINNALVKELYSKLDINRNDFVLSYLGSIGTWYMLDEMLDFFAELLKYKSNSKFLFITREEKSKIISTAKAKKIDANKLIITSSEREDIPSYLALSSLAIFFIKPVFSKKASSPTKQGEIMGLGLPVICNSNIGDVDTIIENSGTGISIKKFDKENYSNAMSRIDELINIDKNRIINEGRKYFDVNKGINNYVQVYNFLVSKQDKS